MGDAAETTEDQARGLHVKEQDDKIEYAPMMEFEREAGDAFSRAVIAAVLEQHPDVFDGDGGEQ